MKKFLLLALTIFILQNPIWANKPFVDENNLWGLKTDSEEILIEPQYKKLIILGESSYIVQKNRKFGLVDSKNTILVPLRYNHAERLLGKYLKIGTDSKFGLYNEFGKELLPVEYSSVDILYGGLFLTCKSNKFGVIDSNGNILLKNSFDSIYMPESNKMRIKYLGKEYEIEYTGGDTLVLPEDVNSIAADDNYLISEITDNPATVATYSAVTLTDYVLKLFSSISPAHEKTIDTLMLSKGVDAVGIYFKLGWIPKYPFVFAKKYYNTLKDPSNGPLSNVKANLKQKLAE